MSIELGKKTENLAKIYLMNHGLDFIQENYRLKFGEIDLIMIDKDILVFIEVKYRKDNNFMEAYESVTYTKQKRIKRTALAFMQKFSKFQNYTCRFDVISLCGNIENLKFHWLKNAFY